MAQPSQTPPYVPAGVGSSAPDRHSNPPAGATSGGVPAMDWDRHFNALARMAAVVGHELTSVLQLLSSTIDRLMESGAATPAASRVARASLERGVRLARQLHAVARTDPPWVQRVEAHQLLASWLSTFQEVAGEERTVELRICHGASVLVDPAQLQTAVAGLVANARDATRAGASITIELSRLARSSGPACRIAVIDKGEGMTDEVANRASEPFFSTHRAGPGIGLGLTISRMIAESHGGSLEIDSRAGLGTDVSIVLPVATDDASLAFAADPLPPARPVSIGRRPHVLVVDDEEAIAEYFRIILSAALYDVTAVVSMRAAVDEFARDPSRYDLVLLDMMLGDGNGADVYRRIKRARPNLPIVVITGFAEGDTLEEIRADGHEILLKPCTRPDVLRAIASAIEFPLPRNGGEG
jgi:CheY-like chemotaxis protein